MDFLFLTAADVPAFVRNDMEEGHWVQEEMSLTAVFPYNPEKVIVRGMRLAFKDYSGNWQVFECRNVGNIEPDHYQQITAEHIAIAELYDYHIDSKEFTNIPPQTALRKVITGTGWSVGNVSVGDPAAQAVIIAQIEALGLNGNVDLTSRPIIYPDKMHAAGYTDFSGDYATLYSMTYTEKTADNNMNTILVTPIMQNGTVLTQQEIDDYVLKTLCKAANRAGLKAADTKGLLMHSLAGEQISAMDTIANDAHDLSDAWEQEIAGAASSGDVSRGCVWQAVQTIKSNWNVHITPRITISASSGITHRYLDITSTVGVYNGVRLSIDKNMTDASVTYDDTDCYTALYGYGGNVYEGNNQKELTFADIVWTATNGHPAKPASQKYLEDPTRTALYGRNGQPRFGFYQNGDITDGEVLLQQTWKALNTQCDPKISIQGTVSDLYRLGYKDEPLALNDLVLIEVAPLGVTLRKKLIRIDTDLVDPTSTTVEVGDYIPNIIYINRDTAEAAKGGGGGGGKGDDNEKTELYEFNQELYHNIGEIGLRAYQRDLDATDYRTCVAYAAIGCSTNQIENIVAASGALVDENGVLIRDRNGNPMFADGAQPMFTRIIQTADELSTVAYKTGVDNLGQDETLYSKITQNATSITTLVQQTGVNSLGQGETLYSEIQQNAQAITLKVSNGQVATELALECGNVHISGGDLIVDGYITSAGLVSSMANFTGPISTSSTIYADSGLETDGVVMAAGVDTGYITVNLTTFHAQDLTFLGTTTSFLATADVDLAHYHAISASESNGVITITQGAAQTTPGTATFNIAATQFYQDAIVAATASGAASVTLSAGGWTGPSGTNTVTASNGASVAVSLPSFSTSGGTSWTTAHKTTVYFTTASVTGTLASKEVDASSVYTEGYTQGYADAGGGQGTYSAGWQAARAMVDPPATIGSGEVLSFDVDVPGATEDTQQTYTFTLQKGSTPAATGYASVALNGNPVGRIEIGSWYTAGQNSVTLSAGGWIGPSGTNTVTASNGASIAVGLPSFSTSGGTTWTSAHKTTVYFTTASVTGTLASKEVDASSVYSAGETAGAAGVTLSGPTWGSSSGASNTFTVTASNGVTLSHELIMTPDSPSFNSSHKTTIFVRSSSSNTIRARKSVDASSVYNEGWAAARGEVVAAPSGSTASFTVKVPASTVDGGAQELTYALKTSPTTPAATGYAQAYRGNRTVAQIPIGSWYTTGWDNATAKVVLPSAGTNYSFSIKVPSSTVDAQTTISCTVSLSSNTPSSSGYANVYVNGVRVGRRSIGEWYTSGYNAGKTAGAAEEAAKYSTVSNAKSGLSNYGYETLYKKNLDSYISVGSHYWFYGSNNQFETLYRKSS